MTRDKLRDTIAALVKQVGLIVILAVGCGKSDTAEQLTNRVVTAILAGDTKGCQALFHVQPLTASEAKREAEYVRQQEETRRSSCEACVSMVRGAKRPDGSVVCSGPSATSMTRVSSCDAEVHLGELSLSAPPPRRFAVRLQVSYLTSAEYKMLALSCEPQER